MPAQPFFRAGLGLRDGLESGSVRAAIARKQTEAGRMTRHNIQDRFGAARQRNSTRRLSRLGHGQLYLYLLGAITDDASLTNSRPWDFGAMRARQIA